MPIIENLEYREKRKKAEQENHLVPLPKDTYSNFYNTSF